MEAAEAHDLLVPGPPGRHEARVAVEVVARKPGRELPGQELPVLGAHRANAQGLAVFEENVGFE